MRAALYGSVSTVDKGQDVERQLRDLPTSATAREWETSLGGQPEIKDFPLDLRVTLQAPGNEATTITPSVESLTSAPLDPGLFAKPATPPPSVTPLPQRRSQPSDPHVNMAADRAWAKLGTSFRLRRPSPGWPRKTVSQGVALQTPPALHVMQGRCSRRSSLAGAATAGAPRWFPDRV
jgi:hypothetical protein